MASLSHDYYRELTHRGTLYCHPSVHLPAQVSIQVEPPLMGDYAPDQAPPVLGAGVTFKLAKTAKVVFKGGVVARPGTCFSCGPNSTLEIGTTQLAKNTGISCQRGGTLALDGVTVQSPGSTIKVGETAPNAQLSMNGGNLGSQQSAPVKLVVDGILSSNGRFACAPGVTLQVPAKSMLQIRWPDPHLEITTSTTLPGGGFWDISGNEAQREWDRYIQPPFLKRVGQAASNLIAHVTEIRERLFHKKDHAK